MSWVVIAHKPSSSDYCMGCCMASYSSDLEIEEFDDRERCILFLAEIESRNEHLESREVGYEITIIEGEEVDERLFLNEAKPILEARLKVEREEEEEKEKQKAAVDQAAREKREREKLAELKERYPDVS